MRHHSIRVQSHHKGVEQHERGAPGAADLRGRLAWLIVALAVQIKGILSH